MTRPRPDPVARERGCIDLLNELGGSRYVLIGGHAVSSYGLPRSSVDLDLVVPEADAEAIRTVLKRRGLRIERDQAGARPLAAAFERWSDGLVNVDLLIGRVSDRRSGASFPFDVIEANSSRRTIEGLAPAAVATGIVASPEMLIVLKLTAGRLVDLRDVTVLSRQELAMDVIQSLASGARPETILGTVDRLARALDTRAFKDSFKGEFRLKEPRYAAYVASARRLCEAIRSFVSPSQ